MSGFSIRILNSANLILILLIFGSSAHSIELPQTFTLDGQLTEAGTQTALEDPSVSIKVQILDPSKNCILYEETQVVDTDSTDGYFSIQVGSNPGAGKRTGLDPALNMIEIFQNTNAVNANDAPSMNCGGTYTPASQDVRHFRLTVTPSSGPTAGTPDILAPDTVMDSVPRALVAQTLQGFTSLDFLKIGSGDLTQTDVQSVFASGNAAKLVTLLSVNPVNYVRRDSTNGTIQIPTASAPASPAAGQIWYDGGVFKYWNGTTEITLGVDGGAVSGTSIQAGTIGGTTAVNTSGNIQTTGDITTSRTFLYDNAGAGPGYVGLRAPSDIAGTGGTSYTLTFPDRAGSNGQVLSTTGGGVLEWAAQGSGLTTLNTLTAATQTFAIGTSGTAPAFVSDTATHTLNIPMASAATVTAGLLSKADYDSFVAKQSATLANGSVLVGNASNVATAVAPSGDVSMTNAGAFTVTRLQNNAVSATAPTTAGQMLRWSGTAWTPNFVGMTDLRSNITGTTQLAATCSAGQTLTFNSAMDNLTCTNIVIGMGQVTTGTLAATQGGTGHASYAVGDLLYASTTTALSRLPAGNNTDVLTLAGGVPTWAAPAGGGAALSGLAAATATNTIANANFAQAWNWDTLTTQTGMSLGSSSATSGTVLSVTSSNNNVASTGNVLKLSAAGASNAAVPLMITNEGTGLSFRVNDDGTDTDTTPFVVDASGRVGIGKTNPGALLDVAGNVTVGQSLNNPASSTAAIASSNSISRSGASTASHFGIQGVLNASGSGTHTGNNTGVAGITIISGSGGTQSLNVGVDGSVTSFGSSATTLTKVVGLKGSSSAGNNITADEAISLLAAPNTKSGSGVITTNYGLYLEAQSAGATNFQLYSAGAADSYFAGSVGIGTTPVSEKLTVAGNIGSVGGQIYSAVQTSSGASPLNYNTNSGNNLIWTTNAATPTLNLQNVKPGAVYSVVIKGSGTGTVTITCSSDAGVTMLPASFVPASAARTLGTLQKSVYTIMNDGENCMITWITGF